MLFSNGSCLGWTMPAIDALRAAQLGTNTPVTSGLQEVWVERIVASEAGIISAVEDAIAEFSRIVWARDVLWGRPSGKDRPAIWIAAVLRSLEIRSAKDGSAFRRLFDMKKR